MCSTCGCGASHHHDGHDHSHAEHDHSHAHPPLDPAAEARRIQVEADLLGRNQTLAEENRRKFESAGILALNVMSSPGAGKTTFLARTIRALRDTVAISVIEGDQLTDHDASRIREAGAPAYQINTGRGCHLDAAMVGHAVEHLEPAAASLLLIENVGNLVCPAEFDLGEAARIVMLAVTEGDDKPLKYAPMFASADLLILHKVDLLPHVEFDVERCLRYAREIRPDLPVLEISSTRGDGMEPWLDWLRQRLGARTEAAGVR